MADQEEFGGKGGSGDVKGDENLFMCPKCAIPLKAKYVK